MNPLPPITISTNAIRHSLEATIARCVEAIAAGSHVILKQSPRPRAHFVPCLDRLGTLTAYRTDGAGLEFLFNPHPLAAAFGEKSRWIRLNHPQEKEATP